MADDDVKEARAGANALRESLPQSADAAALLTRATVESAALAWKLMEVLDDRRKLSPQELNNTLIRMLIGSRLWPDAPQALQILSCIDRMDKKVFGVRKSYDMLSEMAHPNWRGVFGMYSRTDEPNFTAYFGRNLRPTEGTKSAIVNALLGACLNFPTTGYLM